MAAPTSLEYELILKFRRRFCNGEFTQPYQSEDMFLIRWIRAREHDLDKAEDMLRKSLKRRKDMDLDNLHLWKPPAEFADFIPMELLGYDNENCPIFWMHFGKTKFHTIARNGQHILFAKYVSRMCEELQAQMKDKKLPDGTTPVSQFVGIIDMEGFPYSSLASKSECRNVEANQPETLKRVYFINTGIFFPTLFALMKPFLAPATKNKLQILGGRSKWQPVLLQDIPASTLPPEFGGTNTAVRFAGKNKSKLATGDGDSNADFLDAIIPAGETLALNFEIKKKKSTIKWAFQTKQHGVIFSLGCEGKIYAGDENSLVNSHLKLVEGSLTCDALGVYVATFDNSKNVLDVELKYNIWVKRP